MGLGHIVAHVGQCTIKTVATRQTRQITPSASSHQCSNTQWNRSDMVERYSMLYHIEACTMMERYSMLVPAGSTSIIKM